ncbi:MAG: RagB/SusD family nutrient uptake outer membrane protein [Rikenellaceae bacterium]|jgi:hypothetical protein|nr:RagB/SusD family nutrient uptake outer membrane protein [Rikenellaceae bacterium]
MKKIIISLFAPVAALFASCSLDEHPKNLSTGALTELADGPEQLVTGIYSICWSSYMMKKTYLEWLDYDCDLIAGPSWAISGAGQGNVTTHWGYNGDSDLFTAFYRLIYRCNYAQYFFESFADLGNPRLKQLYGEIFFMRAWAYFHLVRMYGPVPLRLSAAPTPDCPRSPVGDIYARIEADLQASFSHLQDGAPGGWGHANLTAAQILLARVYCTMASGKLAGSHVQMYANICNQTGANSDPDPIANGNATLTWTQFTTKPVMGSLMLIDGYYDFDADDLYGKARDLCDEVIGRRGQSFDMLADWGAQWGSENFRNKEFVWGIACYDKEDFRTEGSPYYTVPSSWGGGCTISLSDACWSMYNWDNTPGAINDDRAVKGIWHYIKCGHVQGDDLIGKQWYRFPSGAMQYSTAPDNLGDVKDMTRDLTGWYRGGAWSTKWYWGKLSDPTPVSKLLENKMAFDIVLIRFCEAYLLRAEAKCELNDLSGALADLNEVRTRAHARPITATGQVELRSRIFEERALEFVTEYMRKFDLLRWGMYLNVMNASLMHLAPDGTSGRTMVREERSVLFPLPTSEVNQNKLIYGENNPGW